MPIYVYNTGASGNWVFAIGRHHSETILLPEKFANFVWEGNLNDETSIERQDRIDFVKKGEKKDLL